jgi:hypothetical protein
MASGIANVTMSEYETTVLPPMNEHEAALFSAVVTLIQTVISLGADRAKLAADFMESAEFAAARGWESRGGHVRVARPNRRERNLLHSQTSLNGYRWRERRAPKLGHHRIFAG